jgi:uncharacterized protein involved in exopolysaccharide biosynthesis
MVDEKIYIILFRILRREMKTLILAFFVSFFIFALISYLVPKRYNSTLKFFPNQNENNISSLNAFAQDFGLGGSGSTNFPLSEIASSNIILDKIYYSSFEKINGEATSISSILNKKRTPFFNKPKEESLEKFLTIEKFKDRLSISYDRRSNITSISVSIEDPNVAKQILDLFYTELSLYINKSINNAASYKKNFIEKRSIDVASELFLAESKLEEFLNENKLMGNSPLLLRKWNELKREVSVKESAYIILRKELEIAKIDEVKNTLKIFILEEPEVAAIKSYPSRLSFSFFGALISTFIIFISRSRKELKDMFKS